MGLLPVKHCLLLVVCGSAAGATKGKRKKRKKKSQDILISEDCSHIQQKKRISVIKKVSLLLNTIQLKQVSGCFTFEIYTSAAECAYMKYQKGKLEC